MLKLLVFISILISVLGYRSLLDIETALAHANSKITGEFLIENAKWYPGQSAMFALYPLLAVAGQMGISSKGSTRKEFLQFINLRDNFEIIIIFPTVRKVSFDSSLIGSPSINLYVYTDKNNKFCSNFIYSYNNTFGGQVRVVDYSNPKKAAEEINKQVRCTASRGSKNIISSKMIQKGSGLHFVSNYQITIIYDERFKYTTKTLINFNNGKKIIKFPGVSGQGIVKYADVKFIKAEVIETLAKGGMYSYIMVYPNKRDGLVELLEKFNSPTTFERMLKELKDVCAKLTIPYGDVITNIDLGKSLKQSKYLNDVFTKGALDLCGVSQKRDTYISSILHQVHLKQGPIYKNGTSYTCSDYEIEMVADRPHLFFLTFSEKSRRVRTPIVSAKFNIESN